MGSLFLPGAWLHTGDNEVIVMDLDGGKVCVDQRGRSSDVSRSEGCGEVDAGVISELDLNRRHVVGQGIETWLADFVTAEREVNQVGIGEQHDEEAVLVAELVGEKSLKLFD